MAYRNPRFMFLHALRVAGAGSVTPDDEAAGFPKARLLDGRLAANFKFGTAAAGHTIDVDQGSDPTGTDRATRLIVPAGHNLTGVIDVLEDDNGAFATPATVHSFTAAAGQIDETFAGEVTERFVRVEFDGNDQFELPELFLTRIRTTIRGPEPGWVDNQLANIAETELRSGEVYRLSRGPDRRVFEFEYNLVRGDDETVFEDMRAATANGLFPLYVDPPDDAEPPILMEITELTRREQSPPRGASGPAYRYRLGLREVIA